MALKTLKQIQQSRKEQFRVPRRVQDIIPVTCMWEDGVFQHGQNQYSRSYQFSDINYLVAGASAQAAMFSLYEDLINCLGAGATYKITTNNRGINMTAFKSNTLLPSEDDGLDHYRAEYNDVLLQKVEAADSITQEKYITVSVVKPSIEAARTYFNRAYLLLQSAFTKLGSKLTELNAADRLRIFHDFFHPGEEDRLAFDFGQAVRHGFDLRDAICPSGLKHYANYMKIGNKFARALFCIDYSSYVQDDVIFRLTELSRNIMVSVDVITIPTDEAVQEVELRRDSVEANITRWQTRQNNHNNFSAVIPYNMARQREEMEKFMDDLVKNDQGMNIVTFTIIHMAESLEQLNADTETLLAVRDCKFMPATFQQLECMATALPFGVCRMEVSRTLLTRCLAAISMPFRVQEIQEAGGIWFGVNALSHNLILCNRANLQNQGMFIVGVPGSGKSMMAKELIFFLGLATKDQILINDPDGEYAPIVRALGGTVATLKAGGEDYINAMDMEEGYGEKNAVADKAQYVLSLFEQMEESALTAQEHSIIDRCVIELFNRGAQDRVITLNDLRELLLDQPEREGKKLALTLERFTKGSLDIFAKATNVDMRKRIICFDLHEMRKKMRPAGQTIVTDFMLNRVNINSRNGVRTHIINDEIQEFFKNENSSDFFDSAWRRFRKRNGYPVAITQNVSVLLNSDTATSMLSNSEMIIMLNQAAPDRESLSEIFQIPQEQMNYVKDSEPGCGLIRYGKSIVPFINRFPKNTEMYTLMTTKPDEGYTGGDTE